MPDVVVVGYATAALAYFALAVLPLVFWRNRVLTRWVAIAALATSLWAVSLFVVGVLPFVGELVRYGAWAGVLLFLIANPHFVNAPGSRRLLKLVGAVIGLGLALMLLAALELVLALPQPFTFLAALRHPVPFLMLALVCAVLVEQLYRNTHVDRRWAIKPMCIALAAIFIYDIYLFADATLFGAIAQPLWDTRGLINLLVVPLIAVSVRRSASVHQPITVSRQLMFHSAVLVGSGLYLLIMAAAGYYIRLFGGTWGGVLQAAFLFGAVVLLIAVVLSGSARARIRVLISKHFLRYRYDYREEWLRFIDTLSATDVEQPLRQRAIIALAGIMDSPRGLLFSREQDGGFRLTASWNFGEPDAYHEPADGPLARFLERTGWVIDLEGYRANPEHYDGLDLPQWLAGLDRAWLIVPMQLLERLQGFVILGEPRARRELDWEDHDLLKTAGRQLASYIGLLDATDALMDSRQFDAYNRLSAYVVHDLKNVSAQLGLIVKNAERHADNPEFVADAFATVANAKSRMDRILGHLRKGGAEEITAPERFDAGDALREVVRRRSGQEPAPHFDEQVIGLQLTGNRERFVTAVEHLVQNAQEATPDDGSVRLESAFIKERLRLAITDTGCGMEPAFVRERLFRPFQTTKGNAGMGIGVFEAREIIRAMGGDMDVRSRVGAGTEFTISLPAERSAASMDAALP